MLINQQKIKKNLQILKGKIGPYIKLPHKLILGKTKDIYYKKYNNKNKNFQKLKLNFKITLKTKVFEISPEQFIKEIAKYIQKTDVILDIGCGVAPQRFFSPKVHLCIEPFKLYRETVKPFFPNDSSFIFLKEDALTSIKILDDKSVDTVFMLDLIEHLEKRDGFKLIKEAERVARKQIVVFTPLGYSPQHYHNKHDKDAWGLNGSQMQVHKSGWEPTDFGESWNYFICKDSHLAFLPEEKKKNIKYSSFFAIKTMSFQGYKKKRLVPDFVSFNSRVKLLRLQNK